MRPLQALHSNPAAEGAACPSTRHCLGFARLLHPQFFSSTLQSFDFLNICLFIRLTVVVDASGLVVGSAADAAIAERQQQSSERTATDTRTSGSPSDISSGHFAVPHLLRSRSTSNCLQRTSDRGPATERRFFLPSIDPAGGSVSAQRRRPATSGELRPNNGTRSPANTAPGDVRHRLASRRSQAVTVWNSLTSLSSPTSNPSSADRTLRSATTDNFTIPTPPPPPRKSPTSNN